MYDSDALSIQFMDKGEEMYFDRKISLHSEMREKTVFVCTREIMMIKLYGQIVEHSLDQKFRLYPREKKK